MQFYFYTDPVIEPFYFDSVGNHLLQEDIDRPNGYPLWHYLQSDVGRGLMVIAGKKHILDPGDGVLLAPLVPHAYSALTPDWTTSFATFTGTLESQISSIFGYRSVILMNANETPVIAAKIEEVIDKFSHPPIDHRVLSVDAYSLLTMFGSKLYKPERITDPAYHQYVVPALRIIEQDFDTDLTLKELSARLFVSPQYLTKLFQKYKKRSVYEYLTVYRINKAREYLMVNRAASVSEVARMVGFSDPSHFIRMFKKITTVTPLEFRKMHLSSTVKKPGGMSAVGGD